MKYAIVESGGKQYKAVEGEPIDVDRLPVDVGEKVILKQVLLTVDGDEVSVGTPTVPGIQVSTTVKDHFKGPKIVIFKYSPKKRIRVKGGHRQQYTRLNVEEIGKPGESRKVAKVEKPKAVVDKPATKVEEKKAEAKAVKEPVASKKTPATKTVKSPAKKAAPEKAPAKAPAKKKTTTKTTAKAPAKKKTTTKTPAKVSDKKPTTSKSTKSTKTTK